MFKKAARLREAASAEPGPARPQGFWRAERTREYVSTTKARERSWRHFSTFRCQKSNWLNHGLAQGILASCLYNLQSLHS